MPSRLSTASTLLRGKQGGWKLMPEELFPPNLQHCKAVCAHMVAFMAAWYHLVQLAVDEMRANTSHSGTRKTRFRVSLLWCLGTSTACGDGMEVLSWTDTPLERIQFCTDTCSPWSCRLSQITAVPQNRAGLMYFMCHGCLNPAYKICCGRAASAVGYTRSKS